MSAELTVPMMSPDQAERESLEFVADWKSARDRLLRLFEGGAHRALGYATFEEYAQARLGVDVSERTIQRHLTVARVERRLSAAAAEAGKSVIMTVPVLVAQEINKLPEDKWLRVYEEYHALDNGERTPREITRWAGRIVRRELAPSPDDIAEPPPAPERDPNRFRPIVPETYDTGDDDEEEGHGRPEDAPDGEEEEEEEPEGDLAPEPPQAPQIGDLGPKTGIAAPARANPVEIDLDCMRESAVSFVLTYISAYGAEDKEALLELYMDAKAFKRKYEL